MALSRDVSEIYHIQCRKKLTLKSGSKVIQGYLKWHHSIDCVWFPIKCSLVTLSTKCIVFEIFDFKNAMSLKTGLRVRQSHWKCHHAIEHV